MTSTDFRSSASFGKRQEYIAVAELLRRRFDVYMTLVDDLQIDCIIRLPGKPPSYIDIQIKARSKTAKNASTFAALEIREPRENFLFLFYSEACNTYWVIISHSFLQSQRGRDLDSSTKMETVSGRISLNWKSKAGRHGWTLS
jgi:hypothetical protein